MATVGLSGCRTDVEVIVRSSVTGTGSVEVVAKLDDDATKALGRRATAVIGDDLTKAGWAVRGAQPGPRGGIEIRAERSFANAAQANAALRQLSSATGPLPTLELRTGRTITSRTVTLRGTADLRAGLSAFGDEQLASLLGSASRLGIDDAELRRQAGVPLASAFHFRVAAALNGEATVHWTVPMGQSVPIRAESREWSWATLASAVAVLIGLAGIGWLLRPSARRNPA